jgi:twitching motility protein PilT
MMDIEELLKMMVDKGASDLHLMVGSRPVMRICGALVDLDDRPPLGSKDLELAFEGITDEGQRDIFHKDRELDFAYAVRGLARFRMSVLQQRGTLSIAVRLVPHKIPTIDELELPQICKELILKSRGLILVTGSAGTGKSTTLAAMINHLNETERRNIITIEDPIEYTFSNKKCLIRQRDLGDDTSSFSGALEHALRHDPDVIVIGEMRDLATVSTAVRAAETGHLVLGTLHTNDAAQSIDRMIDIFPYGQQRQVRLQLSQVVEAVLSQRLVRRVGGGRIAAFEIMLGTNSIMKLIREEKLYDITAHIETCSREGMQTMDQALAALVKRGIVTLEEALTKSDNLEKLRSLLTSSENHKILNYV